MTLKVFSTLLFLMAGIALLFGLRQPSAAQNPSAPSPALPLSVLVQPQQIRAHPYDLILLRVQVVNTSPAAQSFRVMSCSWLDEWKAKGASLSGPSILCAANAPITITLAPGASYQKTLEMHPPPGGPGRSSFRIGFTPREGQNTYWSKPVTIQVIP